MAIAHDFQWLVDSNVLDDQKSKHNTLPPGIPSGGSYRVYGATIELTWSLLGFPSGLPPGTTFSYYRDIEAGLDHASGIAYHDLRLGDEVCAPAVQ